jgi:excisionase family DNA binding protein
VLITVSEAARRLGTYPNAINRWIAKGELEAFRVEGRASALSVLTPCIVRQGWAGTPLATGPRWVNDYGATHVPKSNSLTLPFTDVMCCVTWTLSTRPEPFATTCSWPVNVAWKVPCCALSVAPNHSVPRML